MPYKDPEKRKDFARRRSHRRYKNEEYRRWHRNYELKRRFGIGLADYELMLKSQGGKCAICREFPHGKKSLHVDHCHKTGRVRGLLCVRCNVSIAILEKGTKWYKSAIKYLSS